MRALSCLCLLLVLACGKKESRTPARDSLTQRQRDSAIGASSLPGAQGVQGAMHAADSAAARNARVDSIAAGAQ